MEIKKIVLLPDLKKIMFFVEEFGCPVNIVKMPVSNSKRPRQPPPSPPQFLSLTIHKPQQFEQFLYNISKS